MKEITSLFDYFEKVKRDKRYEQVAIKAYRDSEFGTKKSGGFSDGKNWIDNWVKTNVKATSERDSDTDCQRMVAYLNKCMKAIPKWQDETLSEPRLDFPKPT